MILTGDLLTFIVVMTTSLRIWLHILSMQIWFVYVQFSFKIVQMTIWSYIRTVFILASLKLPSNLGRCKLKYAMGFSWDIAEGTRVCYLVWSRNQLINSYVTIPGRNTSLSARNRFTYLKNKMGKSLYCMWWQKNVWTVGHLPHNLCIFQLPQGHCSHSSEG